METKFKTVLIAGLGIFLLSSFIMKENEPEGKKKHVKMVQIIDGEKTVLDTVITDDAMPIKWMNKHKMNCSPDSIKHKRMYTYVINTEGDSTKMKTFAFTSDDDFGPLDGDFDSKIMDDDSLDNVFAFRGPHGGHPKMMMFHSRNRGEFPMPPEAPMPPVRGHMMNRMKHSGNSIDLNDPNIISYKKKNLGGGREKIEIILKKAEEE